MKTGYLEGVEINPIDHARMTINMVRQHILVDRAMITKAMGVEPVHNSEVVRRMLDMLEEAEEQTTRMVSAKITGYHGDPDQVKRRKSPT